ncbi:MAG: ATP-binding cassette domain-containing protein, partial [bacterium]|nr:ATP-binding cassette domain-containing protein [bacterium]
MIQMYHTTKIYDNGVKALDDVTVEFEKGEFVFLVGPTGSGKTTFLRLIFRDESPTEGQVIIDGRNIERLKPYKVPYLRRNIGVVFQD